MIIIPLRKAGAPWNCDLSFPYRFLARFIQTNFLRPRSNAITKFRFDKLINDADGRTAGIIEKWRERKRKRGATSAKAKLLLAVISWKPARSVREALLCIPGLRWARDHVCGRFPNDPRVHMLSESHWRSLKAAYISVKAFEHFQQHLKFVQKLLLEFPLKVPTKIPRKSPRKIPRFLKVTRR